MSEPEIKTCPRCGEPFECRAKLSTPCGCAEVQLAESTLAALQERYADCLCVACLRAIAAGGGLSFQARR